MRYVDEILTSLRLEDDDGQARLSLNKEEALRLAIDNGSQHRSVYTKDLEPGHVQVVRDKSDLPDLNDPSSSEAFDWVHSRAYHAVAAAFPSDGAAAYQARIDIDATTVFTDTLKVVKAPIRMHITPQENLHAEKIKHTWHGESLSSKINIEVG